MLSIITLQFKKTDIGVVVGSESNIAESVADMILPDDNFCLIVEGVELSIIILII